MMLKTFTNKLLVLSLTFSLFFAFTATAQNNEGDIGDFIQTEEALADANKLVAGYIDPFMNGFGSALNSGWYNTAKAHKTLGFDLGFTAGLAYIPDDEMFYTPSDLTYFSLNTGSQAPTIFGPDETPVYTFDPTPGSPNSGDEEFIDGPPGLGIEDEVGFNAAPVVIPQLGIGIVKNTDLKIRWLPEVDLGDDGSFKLFGIGVMHDIKQHIPGLKLAPFDWSVLIAFTDVTTTVDLDDDFSQNNRGLYDVNAWTFQTMVSKKFSVLTLYGALGFNTVKSELKMEGLYDVGTGNQADAIENPLNLSFSNSGPRFTAGMRLKLAIVTLHADYTFQRYNTLSVGFGFAVR